MFTCFGIRDIHYNDIIKSAMASQITSLTILYSSVYSSSSPTSNEVCNTVNVAAFPTQHSAATIPLSTCTGLPGNILFQLVLRHWSVAEDTRECMQNVIGSMILNTNIKFDAKAFDSGLKYHTVITRHIEVYTISEIHAVAFLVSLRHNRDANRVRPP